MEDTATLNTKVSLEDKRLFSATAEALGMNASTALKVFVKKFNEYGGFPFEVRKSAQVLPERIRQDMERVEAEDLGLIPDTSSAYESGKMSDEALRTLGVTAKELGL